MSSRNGFTLVELVVVVLILGILAAVAAPRLLNTSAAALDNGVKTSLTVVRNAIEMYYAENGEFPGADGDEATFKSNLAPYLREFPTCPVVKTNDLVKMVAGPGPVVGFPGQDEAWAYGYECGDFVVNTDAATQSDPSVNYDQL